MAASMPMQQDSAAASRAMPADLKQIRHLRQILLWPVYLLPLKEGAPLQHHWEHLTPDPANPWRELDDEFGDPAEFQERHYNERSEERRVGKECRARWSPEH